VSSGEACALVREFRSVPECLCGPAARLAHSITSQNSDLIKQYLDQNGPFGFSRHIKYWSLSIFSNRITSQS
jgi:hypothetical protein